MEQPTFPVRLVLVRPDGSKEVREGWPATHPYAMGEQLTVDGECWEIVGEHGKVEAGQPQVWEFLCEPCEPIDSLGGPLPG
jgi:hypothetical protein